MISAEEVKKLRLLSGASVMKCKEALKEAEGDLESALGILRAKGIRVAEKKSTRQTSAGVIDSYIHNDGRIGVIVAVKCETDFVARNDVFKKLAHDIAMQIAATNPRDSKELLASPFIKDEDKTVKDYIDEAIAILGENIKVGEFSRFEL